jgi:hypothetical protein
MHRIARVLSRWLCATWLTLGASAARALPLSDADLYLFPLPPSGAVHADVTDPGEFALLRQGTHYAYAIEVRGGSFTNRADPADPATWDVVHYRGRLDFLEGPPGASSTDPFLLLLLGFREELSMHSDPADVGYLRGSFVDVETGRPLDPLRVADGPGGQVPDGFGSEFLAFVFDPLPGARYVFDYSIAIRAPLPDAGRNLAQFQTAFAAAPEPGGLVLLALALAWLSARGSGRGRCGRGRSGT